jgi:hypothetical protein
MPNGFTVRKGKKKWDTPYPPLSPDSVEMRLAEALKKMAKEWAREPFDSFGEGEYSDYDV